MNTHRNNHIFQLKTATLRSSWINLSIVLLVVATLLGCGDKTSGSGPHMQVSLVADQDSVTKGSQFTLGVHFKPDPGWHIYWKNAGDSGLPPQFTWRTTKGVSIQEPQWPYPSRIASDPLVNYALYETLLPFPAVAQSSLTDTSITTSVHVEWLVCKDECLPGEATLSLTLPVTNYPGAPSEQWKAFDTAFRKVPVPLKRVSIAIEERLDEVVIALIPLDGQALPSDITLIPEDRKVIANAAPQRTENDGEVVRLFIKRDPFRQAPITRLRGVLVSQSGWTPAGTPKAVTIDTNPQEPPLRDDTISSNDTSTRAPFSTPLLAALISALIGGLLLNLMPCVFPVLSIKVLGFVQHANKTNSSTKLHGISFSLGVLVSFWILAAILLTVQASGEQLGWGFQLQSPAFVVAMIFIFITLGLVFLSDIMIGQKIQTVAGRSKLPTNFIGSFLNGVLATAVATPCTAPFMSTAVAATLTLPALSAIAIFTALGIGMSIPYLVLSFAPSLLSALPKPGAWMETFKQLMAFPLFASAIWLCRVYARQVGFEPPGVTLFINVLWGILCLGFCFWLLLQASQTTRVTTKRLLSMTALASLLLGISVALPSSQQIDEAQMNGCAPNSSPKPFRDAFGLLWESYSEQRMARILAQGRPVFLDFTAEWCITCQVNERVVFRSQAVRDLLIRKNVTLIRADWTSKNPAITRAIRRFGRNGVPVNVLLASPEARPIVLPNILTPSIVIEALETLPNP